MRKIITLLVFILVLMAAVGAIYKGIDQDRVLTLPAKELASKTAETVLGTEASQIDHVVIISMENKSYDDIVGNKNAPYLNLLIKENALASNYFAITHPSLPNYIAFQIFGNQKIDKQILSEEVSDLSSQVKESKELLSQYNKGKITFTYLKIQSEYVSKRASYFSQGLASAEITPPFVSDTKEIQKLTADFTFDLALIGSSKGDRKQIEKISQNIKEVENKLDKFSEKYE